MTSSDRLQPQRKQARPRHDNDIVVGRYYYGLHCPHCKHVSPFVNEINDNIIGGRIATHATDDIYDSSAIKHESVSSQLNDRVKETFRSRPIEVTPTFIWSDNIVTEGAPYNDDNTVIESETREYLCIRAAVCYMKLTDPGMSDQEIDQLIEQVFTGRLVVERLPGGETRRNPYKGIREITRRF